MESLVEVGGAIIGLIMAILARRRNLFTWHQAWGLIMAVYGVAAGLALSIWSLAHTTDSGCTSISVFFIGISNSTEVNGVCIGRWEAPVVHFILGLVMVAGASIILFLLGRLPRASTRPSASKFLRLLLVAASVMSLTRLVVEIGQDQFNLVSLLPPITFLSLVRGACSKTSIPGE